jgi:cell division protein FtsI/penicillin-binding protein 2
MLPPGKLAERTGRTLCEQQRRRKERSALQLADMRKRSKSLALLTLLFVLPTGLLRTENTENKEKLREAVERAMEGRGGAAVAADVITGEILAASGLEMAAHRLARPGSTVKPFVLMALLASGKLDASQRLLCRRPLRIGGVRMDCTHPSSIGNLDAEEAIAYSCNSYFAEVATRLNGAELVQALRRAGLDSASGLAKEEARGRIEMPRDRDMLQLEALGDRGIEVTPLELLAAYRTLALQKRNGAGAAGVGAPVFAGLEQSVTYGMAHAAHVEGTKVAGKTGTAASRESARTHGFFVGYAPAEKPEIVVVVFVERGNGGDAAGVAQTVFAAAAKNGWKQ